MIKHVVMWKFLEQAEGRSRQENLDHVAGMLRGLAGRVPELLSLEIGQDLGVGRDPYDMVLITTFEDEAALQRYQEHPEHKDISRYVAKVRADRACVDFRV